MDTALMAGAIDGFEQQLRRVETRQRTAPTPCEAWDVDALVSHVVSELLWVPPLLDGATIAEVGDRFDGDVLNDDPLSAWASAAAPALAAAARPGAAEQTVHLSFGDFPGAEYLGQVTSDLVLHSWDLARAVGVDVRFEPTLLEFVDGFLSPQIAAWRSGGAFGPAVETDPDIDTQSRLLAQTGRSPDWTP